MQLAKQTSHNHCLLSLSATRVTTQWLKQPIFFFFTAREAGTSIMVPETVYKYFRLHRCNTLSGPQVCGLCQPCSWMGCCTVHSDDKPVSSGKSVYLHRQNDLYKVASSGE